MDRIVDEIALCLFCLVIATISVSPSALVVSLLCGITLCCWSEVAHTARFRPIAAFLFAGGICIAPSLVAFTPLIAYVLFGEDFVVLRWIWIVPLVASTRTFGIEFPGLIALACTLACVMAWRTCNAAAEREHYRVLRDELQEASLTLKVKNRDLMERRDYEVRLATLDERGRIAREIHDNVGHLLTRSVLQVEAMQVIHADDKQVKEELAQVGSTLHEALDTVRTSVHNLHEDAFDLKTQLERVADGCAIEQTILTYDVDSMPTSLSYAVLAIAKEAVSNVEKHSNATRITISVLEKPAFYQVIIQDNGSLNPKYDASSSTGIGLSTMRERIESFNGRFLAEYKNGWRIFASIPKEESPCLQ